MLVSGAGVQSRPLSFQGKNLQDRVAEVVDVPDGLANSGRQENEFRGRQAGADNLPRAIAMNVLTLQLAKLRTLHIHIHPEIMQQPWPPQSQKGFWDLLPGKHPPKFLFLKRNPCTLCAHPHKIWLANVGEFL